MEQVIALIQEQIKIEESKSESDSTYIQELKESLARLQYANAPISDWCVLKEGSIDVPDELVPLLNKLCMQLRLHTISGKNEIQTLCHMTYVAQKFFHEFKPNEINIKE